MGTGINGVTSSENVGPIYEYSKNSPPSSIQVALLTGGFDKPYVLGLAMALASRGVRLEVIGSDDIDSPEMHATPGLAFLNLRGSRKEASFARRAFRVVMYYLRLIGYAAKAEPRLFHILWNNKFQFVDRIILMSYYRVCGKKIFLTAHNVNAAKRDSNDSIWNRLTLRIQYCLTDHIFVHTERMRRELLDDFGVSEHQVSVIPFGINNAVANTAITPTEAKRWLGVRHDKKIILFFGAIRPYKGLEYLVSAFQMLARNCPEYRLIIAGKPKEGCEKYWLTIKQMIDSDDLIRSKILQHICYIPDQETELYFKAADVLALPYIHVYQSGVLFLAYSFGLPVIATDVGSVRDDVVEGDTGVLCTSCDPSELAGAIERYFASTLFRDLRNERQRIRDHVTRKHSWNIVSKVTYDNYMDLLRRNS